MEQAQHQHTARVVIALRHPAARAAVQSVLETSENLTVAAAVADLGAAVEAVQRTRATILLLDASLVRSGADRIARSLGAAVIIVGIDEEHGFARAALEAGAAAYVVSDASPDAYLEAVEATARAA